MTRFSDTTTNNTRTYQQPHAPVQRRSLPSGTPPPQAVTSGRGATRMAQQPITRRPHHQQRITAAYTADLQDDEEDDDEAMGVYPQRTPSSVVPYRSTRSDAAYTSERPTRAAAPPVRRSSRHRAPETATEGYSPLRRRWHPLLYIGVGLCIMVLGYLLVGAVSSWWQGTWDGWHYGYPRTSQTDAVVGHNDNPSNPSHFIAINLHSHIEVIEFPGGEVTHARVYLGPQLVGNGADLAPVTLTFKDVNGDGTPDMIVSAGGTIVVFLNDQGQFRPLKPGEQVTL